MLSVEPAEQVVAGLLQQHVVVSFVCAVWIVVITQITKPVHWRRVSVVKSPSVRFSVCLCVLETHWPGIRVHRRPLCTPGSPSERSTSPVAYWSSLWHGSPCPSLPASYTQHRRWYRRTTLDMDTHTHLTRLLNSLVGHSCPSSSVQAETQQSSWRWIWRSVREHMLLPGTGSDAIAARNTVSHSKSDVDSDAFRQCSSTLIRYIFSHYHSLASWPVTGTPKQESPPCLWVQTVSWWLRSGWQQSEPTLGWRGPSWW